MGDLGAKVRKKTKFDYSLKIHNVTNKVKGFLDEIGWITRNQKKEKIKST